MEKLKATLTQYSRWQPYGVYVDRMAGHLESDFSVSVENAKALLEGIGKEICDANCIALANAPAIGAVLKTAFRALGYNGEQLVTQVSTSLANIGQLIGTLRNEIPVDWHPEKRNQPDVAWQIAEGVERPEWQSRFTHP